MEEQPSGLSKIFIGVDPGITGAISVISIITDDGADPGAIQMKLIECIDMPLVVKVKKGKGKGNASVSPIKPKKTRAKSKQKKVIDICHTANVFKQLKAKYPEAAVAIEQVGAMPGQGIASTSAFMYGAGAIEGIIASLGFNNYVKMHPVTWKNRVMPKLSETFTATETNGNGDISMSRSIEKRKAKAAAIAAALELIGGADEYLQLAKHDGRAESMLIAAAFALKAKTAAIGMGMESCLAKGRSL